MLKLNWIRFKIKLCMGLEKMFRTIAYELFESANKNLEKLKKLKELK